MDHARNLLTETVEIIEANGLSVAGVRWVGSRDLWTTWENFAAVADITYDHGIGGQEIADDLLIVGDDWWMERHEYDGSEWWEFKRLPVRPELQQEIRSVLYQDTPQGRYHMPILFGINPPPLDEE